MNDIVWEDPPKVARRGPGPGRMAAFVDELKRHPGKWAIYPYAHSTTIVTTLRRRYPGTEVVSRKIAVDNSVFAVNGVHRTIYARWVGES